jgi:hypothetical protein
MKHLLNLIIIFLVFSSILTAQEDHRKNSLHIIRESQAEGKITEEEAMDLKMKLIEGIELPEAFRSDIPIKCGLSIAVERKEYLQRHPEKRSAVQKKAMQSVYNHIFTNKNGQSKTFRINYDVIGANAVPVLDANSNSIPDWVEETGLAFERSYRLEVDTMGYREPLSFVSFGYYEIFIEDLNNVYGYTDALLPAVTNNPDTYNSIITIENDFSEGFFTHGYEALRVTCGHEFFHAIQFSYIFRDSDVWYYELSSTWMEDVTYDSVNDYFAYLNGYFDSPSTSLDETDGYSAAHWNHMIEKKYGRSAIRKSWENMTTRGALTAIDDAIKSVSSSNLSNTFSEFAIWNYYTAGRADSITYFPEAPYYPKVKLSANRPLADTAIDKTLPHLATHYYSFIVYDTAGVKLRFQATESNSYFDVYTIEYNKATGKNFFYNYGGASNIEIQSLLPGDTLTCVVVNTEKSDHSNFAYYLDVNVNFGEIIPDPISNFFVYPSPFVLGSSDDKMRLRFRLGYATDLEMRIFTIDGKMIRKLNFGTLQEGTYLGDSGPSWDGRDSHGNQVPGGVYIYQLLGKKIKKTGKFAVVR